MLGIPLTIWLSHVSIMRPGGRNQIVGENHRLASTRMAFPQKGAVSIVAELKCVSVTMHWLENDGEVSLR